jgi:hypothetical protein
MAYKFEKLDVWQRALDYSDQIHEIADQLPKHERYNLRDQMTRAANSIALNIAAQRLLPRSAQGAEGSTGSSDAEQGRFLQISIRSLLESVACLHLVKRQGYVDDIETLREAYRESETLCPASGVPLFYRRGIVRPGRHCRLRRRGSVLISHD